MTVKGIKPFQSLEPYDLKMAELCYKKHWIKLVKGVSGRIYDGVLSGCKSTFIISYLGIIRKNLRNVRMYLYLLWSVLSLQSSIFATYFIVILRRVFILSNEVNQNITLRVHRQTYIHNRQTIKTFNASVFSRGLKQNPYFICKNFSALQVTDMTFILRFLFCLRNPKEYVSRIEQEGNRFSSCMVDFFFKL